MGQNYGTVTRPTRSRYKFAIKKRPKAHRQLEGLVSFARILVVVAEVGLSMLPGIGTAAQVGIGLAAAGINTGLSVASNSVSAVGIGIDFGTAFLPAAFALRSSSKITKSFSSELTGTLEKSFLKKSATKLTKTKSARSAFLEKNMFEVFEAKHINKGMRLQRKALNDAKKLAQKMQTNSLSNIEKATIEANLTADYNLGSRIMNQNLIEQKWQNILSKYNTTIEQVENKMKEWKSIFEQVKSLPKAKLASKSDFLQQLKKIGGEGKFTTLKNIYTPALYSRKAQSLLTQKAISNWHLNNIAEELSPQGREYLEAFINNIKAMNPTTKKLEQEIDIFIEAISNLGKSNPNIFLKDLEVIDRLNKEDLFKSLKVFSTKAGESGIRRWVKFFGSSRFNEKWVQGLQLIDPNDAGRMPIELAYKWLRRKIKDKLAKKAMTKAARFAKKGLKRALDVEEAFVKSGGTALSSNYLLGIKIMPGGTPFKRMVLVKFNKYNTRGKKDIFVWMTDQQIKRLVLEGSSYWWRVGARYGWFKSRGGRKVHLGSGALATELSLFLGFLPIPALKNLQSIVSNWITNVSKITHGNYFDNYIASFERAFVRSFINRSARLTTRVVLGGIATNRATKNATKKAETKFESLLSKGLIKEKEFNSLVSTFVRKAARKSAWVGRELQRFSMAILASVEGRDKNGYFIFKGDSKNSTVGTRIMKKLVFSAVPRSAKGATMRKANAVAHRRGTRNYGRELVSIRRKLSIGFRTSSSITPPGVKGLRKITKL